MGSDGVLVVRIIIYIIYIRIKTFHITFSLANLHLILKIRIHMLTNDGQNIISYSHKMYGFINK